MAFFPQIFQSQVKSIEFAPAFILYVRCHWSAGSIVAISRPEAKVTKLPEGWGDDFNFFEQDNNMEDPQASDKLSRAIKNPITSDMVAAYRYWQPKDPVFETKNKTDNRKKWVIDYACYAGVINGFPNGQFACGEDRELIEQQMYESWFEAYGFPTDREQFKTTLSNGIINNIPEPPSDEFWAIAARANPHWRAHEEPDGTFTDYHAVADAVMIFNLTKMRGAQKADSDGKKPDDLSFEIGVPHNFDKDQTSSGFKIEVGLYRPSKPAVPPKASEEDKRVNFPLVDKEKDGDLQYLVPDWEPWPQKDDHTQDVEIAGFTEDTVRITISYADKKKPKVSLERTGGGGGPS